MTKSEDSMAPGGRAAAAPQPHRSAEAFKIMAYRCDLCAATELIWNSRDGVTPFCVECSSCGTGDANHVNWSRDVYAPNHRPLPGQRYFRDGLRAEARSIARRRLESARGTPYELPEDEWAEMIERIVTPDMMPLTDGTMVPSGEFADGWPKLVIAGSDADTLPPIAASPASPSAARPANETNAGPRDGGGTA